MKHQPSSPRSDAHSRQPNPASAGSEKSQRHEQTSAQATQVAKQGEPLAAKNHGERSPKQENL
jgi:hypothetical protein